MKKSPSIDDIPNLKKIIATNGSGKVKTSSFVSMKDMPECKYDSEWNMDLSQIDAKAIALAYERHLENRPKPNYE
jgi:hypothetical protein